MKFSSPQEFFYKINVQFNWVLAAPLGLFIILYLEWRDDTWRSFLTDDSYRAIINYTLLPIIIGLWIFAFKSFRDKRASIDANLTLQERLELFINYYMKSQVYFTISALIAMIGLFLTGSNLFAAYYLILIFYISFNRPSANYVNKMLKLGKEEREILIRKKPF